jgi:hypothetical protein
LKSKKFKCFDPNIGCLSKKGITCSTMWSIFVIINSHTERFLYFITEPPPKKTTKLSNNKRSLECWAIEKRNEVYKPLLVLDFWTTIKKLDSPALANFFFLVIYNKLLEKNNENPATHSGCKLLFLIKLFKFSVAGIVIGNASFK